MEAVRRLQARRARDQQPRSEVRRGKSPLSASEGAQPAGTLVLDFWPPEL